MSTVSSVRQADAFLENMAYIAGVCFLASIAAWPIYQSWSFILLAVIASAIAIALVGISQRFRWSPWLAFGVAAVVFVLLGVPLAVPSALGSIGSFVGGLGELVTGVVTGWRQLLTLDLPVGSYRATLVPFFIVMLFGALAAGIIALRSRTIYYLTVPLGVIMIAFGLIFGSSQTSGPLNVGPLVLVFPRETLIGVGTFALAVGWLIWRSWAARTAAVRSLQASTGIKNAGQGGGSLFRRVGLAALMLVIAVVASSVAAPALANGRDRDVLRTNVEPLTKIREEVSPLTLYRDWFSADNVDKVQFTVDVEQGSVDRVRLATLSYYDGQVFRVADPASAATNGTFSRVPFRLTADSTTPSRMTVAVEKYSSIWVPTAGELTSISFGGPRQQALSDGFFYNRSLEAGVALSADGLTSGDSFQVEGGTLKPVALADLQPLRSTPADADVAVIPDSLVQWVKLQDVPPTGAGLETLLKDLRARGFLSHSLSAGADGAAPAWAAHLGDYEFVPSRAGQSVDRIDELFSSLNDKQATIGGNDDAALVAAVGDDEQFAVAGALLARQLGFDSRVVLGARLSDSVNDPEAIPACDNGACKGENLTAWVEVRGTSGEWATVDVTPQHSNSIAPDTAQRTDPKVPTDVTPVRATQVLPDPGQPSDEGTSDETKNTDAPVDLTWLWQGLRVAGVVLLVLFILSAPILTIVGAKIARRRGRRNRGGAEARIAGGWDELVDVALDYGLTIPSNSTRVTLAQRIPSESATQLAHAADRAVFGWQEPTAEESIEFWRIVDSERAKFSEGLTRRQRLTAALSVRSFSAQLDLNTLLGKGKK